MIIDISVAVIAATFIVLVFFVINALIASKKSMRELNRLLHATKNDLDKLSDESLKLIKSLNETTHSVNKKLHILDPLFTPFEHETRSRRHGHNLTSDIAECLAAALVLFQKIKEGVRDYAKSK